MPIITLIQSLFTLPFQQCDVFCYIPQSKYLDFFSGNENLKLSIILFSLHCFKQIDLPDPLSQIMKSFPRISAFLLSFCFHFRFVFIILN